MTTMNPGSRIVTKIVFPVADMGEALAFYRQLGFDVETYDGGYSWVTNSGAEVLHLALAADLDRAANPSAGYFHVQDVDDWHAAWTRCGAEVSSVEDHPWQMREFSLRDPSGNFSRVGQNL
jgi:catechol-2,3-dioxygenase